MTYLYSLLMYLLTPYMLLRLWWKGRRLPAYRKGLSERFCLGKREEKAFDVWVHAVSLGEMIAATPLIDALLDKKKSVLVTTMTPTGLERVQVRFGNKVTYQYLPYDLPGVLKRFFRQRRPRVGIIMETELWPNLIAQTKAAKVPLLLANARLSERSLKGYLRFKFLFGPLLNQFSAILAQSEEDVKRFISLGAEESKVQVLGNIKFDLQTQALEETEWTGLKNHWGNDRVVVIAASTHANEEEQILLHWRRLQEAIPNVLLLIAPRHPERFQTVYQSVVQAGFHTGLRSRLDTLTLENEVVVLDSLGELLGFYMISDFAFVGGSLVPVGGHNVLEPIAMGVPVLTGNQVHNFASICKDLREAQAIILVHQAGELVDAIIQLHANSVLKNQQVNNARVVLESNRGSLTRHLEKIENLLMTEYRCSL